MSSDSGRRYSISSCAWSALERNFAKVESNDGERDEPPSLPQTTSTKIMRSLLLSLVASIQLVVALPAQDQLPFSLRAPHADYQQHHSHPALLHHKVRLREPRGLCDPAVKSWAGYLDVAESADGQPSRHFFSWIFESRSDPKNDPVVLW